MKLKLNFLPALMIFLVITGCATIGEYAEIMRPQRLSREYLRSLDEWTRGKTVYSEFSTRAKMVSTLRGREFVQSYLEEYGRIYSVESGTDERKHPAIEAAAYATEFLLYVYVPDRQTIDLDRSDSVWKAFLLSSDGRRFEPLEIRELRDVSPLVTE
ncbi:MAG: hypothetical protein PHU03_08195, partial [Syntrophales bacterium]|nr:hypothetical protein [Syntrophales bacterium]